jgi:hypothetical protein
MPPLDATYNLLLEKNLLSVFVPHLPALLKAGKPAEDQNRKNLSRAFSAFTLHHLTGVKESEAAQAVVDDYDDFGVDAIYNHAPSGTLYLIQSKLKAAKEFTQDEALAFCQGIRKIIQLDFAGVNAHITRRATEIQDALESCTVIQLVISHTGSGISAHAETALRDLMNDESHGEERFAPTFLNFEADQIVTSLQTSKAYKRVDERLVIRKCNLITVPRVTYYGQVNVSDLVALHVKHGKNLYEKNIRTFLGHDTDVNRAIQKTLADKPEHFFYLNNGVTVLCQKIEPKESSKHEGKRLVLTGLSVVNGAQTIASAAKFMADNPGADIQFARVAITLILADSDSEFGKTVTRARNHQNPVEISDFLALDDEQERLRRDLAHLDIHYVFQAGVVDDVIDDNLFRANEAAHALALFQDDPRFIVWLKKEPSTLLDTSSTRYKKLFTKDLTAYQLANAVRFSRFICALMRREARGTGPERLTYKHGVFALAWILARRVEKELNSNRLFDTTKIATVLSRPTDELRQLLWNKTNLMLSGRMPLGFFRNQEITLQLLVEVMVENYNLVADTVVPALKVRQDPTQAYPQKLFEYLRSKAPQIGGLT